MAAISLVADKDQPEVAITPLRGLFQASRVRKNRRKKGGLFCWGWMFCSALFVVVLTQRGTTGGPPQGSFCSAQSSPQPLQPNGHAWRCEGCSLCSQ